MTARGVWLARLGSRWRKWLRDPAAFGDELPSPGLRAAMVGGLRLGAFVADLLGAEDRMARAEWRRLKVELVQTSADGRRFEFLTAAGASPPVWPSHALVGPAPGEIQAIAVAFSDGGEVVAAEVSSGRPGLLTLGGRPASVRIYRTDQGGVLPARLPIRPVGRSGLVDTRVAAGETVGAALREAWPPMERRSDGPGVAAYRAWIAANEPRAAELEEIRAWIDHTPGPPSIAVIMPVHDPRPEHLRQAMDSVRAQLYPAWTLCIADDGSRSPTVREMLREAGASDPRIRLTTHAEARGVAEATNAALALADADVALFLDHDDVLAPHA
ncbi:MAG TPA: glycosyltransferase, partial [Caulobacteraceae bacterium]